MSGFSLPFWFFCLVISDSSLLTSHDNAIIDPAKGWCVSNDFRVIKYNIHILKFRHAQIDESDDQQTGFLRDRSDGGDILWQMIDVPFFSRLIVAK